MLRVLFVSLVITLYSTVVVDAMKSTDVRNTWEFTVLHTCRCMRALSSIAASHVPPSYNITSKKWQR